MLRLTRLLFQDHPSRGYADYYERALYNGILASQDPESGMMTYFQATRPGYVRLFHTPEQSFWCCTGTGMENHAKYADSIYFRGSDALWVNLFIPSVVTWKEKGLTLRQTTTFPETSRHATHGDSRAAGPRHPATAPAGLVHRDDSARKRTPLEPASPPPTVTSRSNASGALEISWKSNCQ